MIKLNFDEKFYDRILKGVKTQTTRDHLKKGLTDNQWIIGVFKDNNGDEVNRRALQVNRIVEKKFKHLSDNDAKREGYNVKTELQEVLGKYYNLTGDDEVYCIEFRDLNIPINCPLYKEKWE